MAKVMLPAIPQRPMDVDMLVQMEQEAVKRINVYGASETAMQPAVAFFTLVNDSDAWTLHLGDDDAPMFGTFAEYIEHFDWKLTNARLYQLMASYRKSLIAAANKDADAPRVEGINYDWEPRKRSLGVSSERFVTTSLRELDRVLATIETRAHNVTDDSRQACIVAANDLKAAVADIRAEWQSVADGIDANKAQATADRKQAAAAARAEKAAARKAAKAEAADAPDDDSDDSLDD